MRTVQDYDLKKQLLVNALNKGHINAASYSLDGYREEAVCIEKEKNKWLVYDGERGQKHNLEQYKDFEVAGYRLINRISDSDKIEAVIMVDYMASILSYAAVAEANVAKRTTPLKTSVRRTTTRPQNRKAAVRKK